MYVSPLKALAADIARNLMRPVSELSLNISIDTSGDTMPIAIHHAEAETLVTEAVGDAELPPFRPAARVPTVRPNERRGRQRHCSLFG